MWSGDLKSEVFEQHVNASRSDGGEGDVKKGRKQHGPAIKASPHFFFGVHPTKGSNHIPIIISER